MAQKKHLMQQLLEQIADRITGINVEDMTTAEKQIAEILVEAKFLEQRKRPGAETTYERTK